ncbi:transglycosylase family protein [Streptomyces sp. JB150]|uniref:LysM peptidoglycan-binding domain-containing protein n=1 Tax=Streptomyces sp. JB150 TaxID=2714844 RepID=UPI00140A97D2|nr:transglycosylase family protein [Streptomyces sp. JB150]QIJ63138.1 LysM peptidoglycan-binding domain-containing protein [Streptomyces sp. JB150]
MLSGNGRHRRPRQAPALIVAAGVTGSAIAIPLLGASGASAASGVTWDRVAECESGGSWSADNGNGYYGGLQISQENWVKYGGLDYAESPDVASRSQQIAVAERILAAEGVAAWPTCGVLAGLDGDSAAPGVDTGLAADAASGVSATPDADGSSASPESGLSDSSRSSETSGSSGSSGSSGPGESSASRGTSGGSGSSGAAEDAESSGSAATSPSPSASGPASSGNGDSSAASTKRDDSDNSGHNDPSSGAADTGSTGTGRHRGDSAEEEAADSRTTEPSGRHASRDSAAARDAADGTYTVRAGDSLWGIADSLELDGGWSALYAENKATVGTDPDLILPGQTLEVGVEPGEK